MALRFWLIRWIFSVKNAGFRCRQWHRRGAGFAMAALRLIQRLGGTRLLLGGAWLLSRLGFTGAHYRRLSAVASANYRSLIHDDRRINAGWIARRRRILEQAATWGQDKLTLAQIAACSQRLDDAVAALDTRKTPVILAPLHTVSDVIAAMVGAGVKPGRASVVVSASAAQFDEQSRQRGGVALEYCSINQDNPRLATQLMSLMVDVKTGQQNLIIFPDITPDYTEHGTRGGADKFPCRLFGLPARLHNGVVRLSAAIGAQIIFYRLHYRGGIGIDILPPVAAADAAARLPEIIESTLRDYPDDWLLWHSHSLYFINN